MADNSRPQLTREAHIEVIEDARRSIDNLDSALVSILAERFRLTEKIGKAKAAMGIDAMDPVRERAQFERFRKLAAANGLNVDVVIDVMTKIIQHVKDRHRVLLNGR